MEIVGAEVDVTFIDLPGIIANAEVITLLCLLTLKPEDDQRVGKSQSLSQFLPLEECFYQYHSSISKFFERVRFDY
jgi:hypothetical protein